MRTPNNMGIKAKQIPLPVRNAISRAQKAGKSSKEIMADALNAWPTSYINVNWNQSESIVLPLRKEDKT